MSKLIDEGATAKIYRNGDIATKAYSNATAPEVKNEINRQQFAYDAGLVVPNVYEVKRLDDGRIAFDMEYIDGTPLIHHDMNEVEMVGAMNILVTLQCEMHQILAAELPKLSDIMIQKIRSTNLESEVKNELLTLLSQLDDKSEKLCHGDFHPLNVLYDGKKYWIIDWVDAAAGSPLADVCRTYLLMKPQIEKLAVLYLKVLCNEKGCQINDVLKWQPVVAAARLSENIDDLSRDYLHSLVQNWFEGGSYEN